MAGRGGTPDRRVEQVLHVDHQPISAANPMPVDLHDTLDVLVGDESLSGERTTAKWFPAISGSFHAGYPGTIREEIRTGGAAVSFATNQLRVTVPAGGEYLTATVAQIGYTNGQETRSLFTHVLESAPAAGVTAIFWMLSRDRTSGVGVGHHNGQYVFARRYEADPADGRDIEVVNEPDWSHRQQFVYADGSLHTPDMSARQISRLRMLYLGFGPLMHELRNRINPRARRWMLQHATEFIDDTTDDLANLSNPNLGWALWIVNEGTPDCVVRTQSFGIGPVLSDVGEEQPDGDRRFPRADGQAVDTEGASIQTSTPLGAAGVWGFANGDVAAIDTDGWKSIEIDVVADQVSGTNGILIEYLDDVQAASPVVIAKAVATYTADDVTNGFKTPIRLGTAGDGFRISYTNGGVAQATFRLVVTLRTAAVEPVTVAALDAPTSTTPAIVGTTGIYGEDPITPGNVNTVYADTGHRLWVNIAGQEIDIAVAARSDVTGNAITLLTTAITLLSLSPPANAVALKLQSSQANSKGIYLSDASATCTAGSAMHEFSAGESFTMPVDGSTLTLYAANAANATQVLRYCWLT